MSNLKNLKETLKLISEKKDPILSMYVGNPAHLCIMQDDNGELYISALLHPGKAKITTREIGETNFLGETDYEIVIRKNTGKALDIISYNPNEKTAMSTTIKKEDGFVSKTNTFVESNGDILTGVSSKTNSYTYDNLSAMDSKYDYAKEPIQVIYGILNGNSKKVEFLPVDYYDEFVSRIIKNEKDEFKNVTITKDCGEAYFETQAYSAYDIEESIKIAYQEYINGELRSSSFDLNKSRNK